MALRKFSTTFLMSNSATDARQTPAFDASVEVYRQGGKVVSDTTVLFTAPTTINLRGVGAIEVGDTLQAGTDTARQMTVNTVTSATAITATAIGIANISLLTNERLVVVGATVPTLYNNAFETGTPLVNPATADSQGYIEFYTADSPFDLIVRRSGMSPEVYEDLESGTILTISNSENNFYNVMDFTDVATALEEIPAGSRLYFPSSEGPFIPPDASGWHITKAVEIFSDGSGVPESLGFHYYGSGVEATQKNATVWTIDPGVSRVYLHDLVISNNSGALTATDGTGDGIRVNSTGGICQFVSIERCAITYAGRNAIRYTGNTYTVVNSLRDVTAYGCRGYGMYLSLATQLHISNCVVSHNNLDGLYLNSCANGFVQVDAETNAASATLNANNNGQIVLVGCSGMSVMGCNVEDFTTNTAKSGIVLNNSYGCLIGGNELSSSPDAAGSHGIYVFNTSQGNSILANVHGGTEYAVEIVSAANDGGNFVAPQRVAGTATGLGKVTLPAGHRCFALINNQSATGSDNLGVGIYLPAIASASVHASVLLEGLLFYDLTNHQVMVRKAATTVVVP